MPSAFRCCYCYNLNEAKKLRPSAPPLEGLSKTVSTKQNSNSAAENGSDEISTESPEVSEKVKGKS